MRPTMKITSAQFVKSAPDFESCPPASAPEFAFIGRSNVGKSALLNMITGQKHLAKVSSTPGATRLINFFEINKKWGLIDLPGYGYAKVGKDRREEFQVLITDYLTQRESLRCIFVLVGSDVPPQKLDLEFCGWLAERGLQFVIVFTKTDRVKTEKLKKNIADFLAVFREYCEGEPRTFITSAKNGKGRNNILTFLDQAI